MLTQLTGEHISRRACGHNVINDGYVAQLLAGLYLKSAVQVMHPVVLFQRGL